MKRPLIAALACALCLAVPALGAPKSVDGALMDRSVRPGDDFFRYANGQWLKTAEIPADRSSWGEGAEMSEKTAQRIRGLIEAAASKSAAPASDEQLVGDFYKAFMDQARIDAKGLEPVSGRLQRVAAIADRKALAESLGQTITSDLDPLNNTNFHSHNVFGLWIAQDLNRPDRNTVYLLQGGLGLPDSAYYLDTSAKMAELRDKYRAHIAAMLRLAGISDPEGKAALVFELERKIAATHVTREDSEDVLKANNPWARADFGRKAPGLDWDAFFKAAGLERRQDFIVWQPKAVVGEAALVSSEPLEAWKAYLSLTVLDQFAPVLPHAFAEERFEFYGHTLSGTPKRPERWKEAVDAVNYGISDATGHSDSVNDGLGDAVGRMYVKAYFTPQARAQVQAMVTNIKAAFARRIDALSWMAPATKREAKAKLKTLIVGVGYPDHGRDYTSLKISSEDAFSNVYFARRLKYRRDLAKLDQPVDRNEWWMDPQLVNAVNLPVQNAINFPAAILQAPDFDPAADPAVNYGAIGATIGHEISHSFDDQGSQFDSTGKLRNWWTPQDFAHFRQASGRLAAQFDGYRPFPDLHVNGKQTLSENIADLAGLAATHDAWRMSLKGKPAPAIGGVTGEQRFFIAYAQSWRNKIREARLRQQLVTDGHAPAEYRADTVRNLDAWYAAFGVKPGDKLYLAPKDRVRMW
jgi:predicted metalloendopeptidase